jgi:phosphoribosylanthranilate isomerase
VKICGITRKADALFCAAQGANALGFIFYKDSPRYIAPAKAARIIASLPPFVTAVGVFVNQSRRDICRVIEQTGISTIQFSGDESPDDCEGYPLKTIKAFRVRFGPQRGMGIMPMSPRGVSPLEPGEKDTGKMPVIHMGETPMPLSDRSLRPLVKYRVAAALLDGAAGGLYGGSGQLADFRVARQLKKHFPVILAGGLTPDNIVDAARRVQPYALDVNSGVESSPGKKHHAKVALLFRRINEMRDNNTRHRDTENSE